MTFGHLVNWNEELLNSSYRGELEIERQIPRVDKTQLWKPPGISKPNNKTIPEWFCLDPKVHKTDGH